MLCRPRLLGPTEEILRMNHISITKGGPLSTNTRKGNMPKGHPQGCSSLLYHRVLTSKQTKKHATSKIPNKNRIVVRLLKFQQAVNI